ncbi:bifunctional methylenetetrahydrofolate dehydrogenase/methenyltetrahydrofolate cyclohydrolase FolD [Megamonas hypermegale]|uniref:bifunctional methylenetetrahydrofolate dehydrogenase/methenyltetrahydrofolate cyclohydrolase FolD n=1 Tax=Megamonas hypermegale TaxID=158847 RepID=UPI0019575B5B|nr:bifunctional methylenetetrahydrofolate dehydrogenase/methenyltetrahydrofolate cyclohydrolase FolD [Megamonas hypermegale]MBM6760384.1 bifunctional methylenetetrahydrofolate dehydrogenase/methenyltetrahydrofolate cyclohydrolase FolD [Megamonas hypermegale]
MTATILSGKVFATQFKEEAKKEILNIKQEYGVTPGLAVIIVGENPASKVYVRNKHKACEEIGIYSEVIEMPETTTKEELIRKIDELNFRKEIHGILVQLPLPKAIAQHEEEILNEINPFKDVDGFHPINVGKLVTGQEALIPCTPHGCLKMLEASNINIDGAHAVVIGRSNIVGKPMAHLLLSKNATVTICHSHTKNLKEICKSADIIIAAIGKPKFITADMIKPGATVIDVGINRIAPKKLVGDVDFENAVNVAGAITPVPGGVGLLTIAMLMQNTVTALKMQLANQYTLCYNKDINS